jgi:hypothetical protein
VAEPPLTTAEIRTNYAASFPGELDPEWAAEFDAWQAAHDRETAERAWEEGWQACEEAHDGSTVSANPEYHVNPYREETTHG